MRRLALIAGLGVGLVACSGGSDIDQRFAEACENTPMLKNTEPCRNPNVLSDEQKEQMVERMGELKEGMADMQKKLDAAVEEAQQQVENTGN